ncbi:hypothetical protein HDU85_000100 [Gaertneriomyces sp. JEL0708]|nr:hypothetical protein HDU85_000100 [Gaertneriomyces sp. JEL0708]
MVLPGATDTGSPRSITLSAERKRTWLANLAVEQQRLRANFEEETERLSKDLMGRCEVYWEQWPVELRSLMMETFIVKYGGDYSNWRTAMVEERTRDVEVTGPEVASKPKRIRARTAETNSEAISGEQSTPAAQIRSRESARDSMASIDSSWTTPSTHRMTLRPRTRMSVASDTPDEAETPRMRILLKNDVLELNLGDGVQNIKEDLADLDAHTFRESKEEAMKMANKLKEIFGF